ncbi:response regulator [Salibacterium aidingense]|uniref:response regulator n=1 Tax=Salibacterium aidingense TaxID=384933 RepID=UPI000408FF7F|nr:response regulator [Salibacterium aidingense]
MIQTLIVEDDPMVAKFNRLYLEKVEGFKAAAAVENVEEAWKYLNGRDIDLILLDIYMVKKTGMEMLKDLRKTGSPVDVIVITAADDKETVQDALRYGAVDYLIKPFHFERFQEALRRYRYQQDIIKKEEPVTQKDLDPFFQHQPALQSKETDLPKGLTPLTFSRIAEVVESFHEEAFSAGDVAEHTGISQVSVRKYLHYLVDQDVLGMDVIFQATGRPLHQFRLKPGKLEMVQRFQAK